MFSLANLAAALQGGDRKDGDEEGAADSSSSQTVSSLALAAGAGLRSMAGALSATVRSTTTELQQSLASTDWRAEVNLFHRELAAESAELRETCADAAAELPERAQEALKHSKARGAAVLGRAQEVLLREGGLGQLAGQGGRRRLERLGLGLDQLLASLRAGAPRPAGGGPPASPRTLLRARAAQEWAALRVDPGTYTRDPDDAAGYRAWRATQGADALSERGREAMAENEDIGEQYRALSPEIVSETDFWARYLFRAQRLRARHEQLERLVAGAREAEEEVGWSDDDEGEDGNDGSEAPREPREQEEDAVEEEQKEREAEAEQARESAHLPPAQPRMVLSSSAEPEGHVLPSPSALEVSVPASSLPAEPSPAIEETARRSAEAASPSVVAPPALCSGSPPGAEQKKESSATTQWSVVSSPASAPKEGGGAAREEQDDDDAEFGEAAAGGEDAEDAAGEGSDWGEDWE